MATSPQITATDSKPSAFRLKLGIRQKVMLVLVTVLLLALTISGWLALRAERAKMKPIYVVLISAAMWPNHFPSA
jgi:hypothetical protein